MTLGLFNGDIGLGVVIVFAIVAIVAMMILGRLIRRDPNVRTTRFGWFVERLRYDNDEPVEPYEHVELPSSVAREIDVDEDTKTWPIPPSEGGTK